MKIEIPADWKDNGPFWVNLMGTWVLVDTDSLDVV